MKIAKILIGSPNSQKGAFNNVMARTRHLMDVEEDVDCYMIRLEYGLVLRLLKGKFFAHKKEEYTIVDGISFRNLWIRLNWYDYIYTYKLHASIVVARKQLQAYIDMFQDYDILSTHGYEAVYLASLVKKKYNISFVSTWHGSDINIMPFYNKQAKHTVQYFLSFSDFNFFVSQKLKDVSDEIANNNNKAVLYTGPAKSFTRLSEDRRKELRQQYGITTKYVVGFIGNIIPIKNVMSLPYIFSEIQKKLNSDVSFVIVGNGELNNQLNQQLADKGVNNIHHFGLQTPDKIPFIMNTLDVLVLPSLNEGMPRVTLEAQACGVHVVGSDRGGIPEAIGSNNCFALDNDFEKNISNRILELLINDEPRPTLPEKFSWTEAVRQEVDIYRKLTPKVSQ